MVRYIYVGLEKLPQHRLFVSIRLKIKHRRVKFWSPVKFSIIVKYPNVDWNHQSKSPEIKSKLLKFKCQSVEYQSVQNIPKYKLNYSQISRQTADNICKMFWWWGQEKYRSDIWMWPRWFSWKTCGLWGSEFFNCGTKTFILYFDQPRHFQKRCR